MRNNFFVVDTNTLVSAFIFRYSNPRKAFEKVVKEGEVFASLKTYNELSEVLLRPKFDKYISSKEKLLALKEFKDLAIFSETSETITECRDPKDNKFLELAVAVKASCIITGDKDLLILHPFRNIPILSAVDFLNNFQTTL
ncbi:MAG: putative toxin-antitoxin system toxin component, PIN family [Bacteroidetes bacterium]|nr:putative toxin-antitoxin system toxin component, PIN family [Bacteroidota bacterium]